MHKYIIFFISILGSLIVYSQNSIKGVVVDNKTQETLIGANVTLSTVNAVNPENLGAATNIDGEFEFNNLSENNYKLTVSYIGYESESRNIDFEKQNNIAISIALNSDIVLDIVNLISDQAEFRKTPVSLSNVRLEQIENELAGQDIPMLLNYTPGVYATEQGGGDGDVRINIRGFDQRNVAVLIDGIPMNDMENGQVYWSNWSGLDFLTKNVQVQRGLGASKLALPSVGGTINTITKGIDAEEGGMIKQEYGSGNKFTTSFAYSTKDYKIGKFNIAASVHTSKGIVEQTPSKGLFYYLKWQKAIGNHVFSLSGFGNTQEHYQRKWKKGINSYDKDYAASIGVADTTGEGNYGLLFNPNWGEHNNYDIIYEQGESNIDISSSIGPNIPDGTFFANGPIAVDTIQGENILTNTQKNYYHKPVFSFQHLWDINEKSSWTNILYSSFGKGGGTSIYNSGPNYLNNDGRIDMQTIYDANSGNIAEFSNIDYDLFEQTGGNIAQYWLTGETNGGIFLNPLGISSIDPRFSTEENKSTNILESSVNNHSWHGVLSTFNYEINENLDMASGIDLRTYRGEHYREVYDLLGGDYFVGSRGAGQDNTIGYTATNFMLREGDKIKYHNDGLVRWAGGFNQIEYNKNQITAFINITGSQTSYKRIDFFKKRDLVLGDTIISQAVGIISDSTYFDETLGQYVTHQVYDTLTHNGTAYTMHSKEARAAETEWEHFPGFTFKAGANWNIDEYNNVFLNAGFLSIAPKFNNVFGYDNYTFIGGAHNEIVKAIEMGYGFKSAKLALNFNAYHTIWQNKPQKGYAVVEGESLEYRIPGMNALNQGLELDFAYKISDAFTYEFLSSLGDWRWKSGGPYTLYDNQEAVDTGYFNAENIRIGDAPQTQIGSSIAYNYQLNKKLDGYVKIKGVYYDRFFADFDPSDAEGLDMWQMPAYTLFNLHLGNTFYFEKSSISLRLNVLNLFDKQYLSDANNNDDRAITNNNQNSDAASAGVFFGLGRRFITSIEYKF